MPGRGGRELSGPEDPAHPVDHRGDVGVLVSVDATGDGSRSVCQAVHGHSVLEFGVARAGRDGGQDIDWERPKLL